MALSLGSRLAISGYRETRGTRYGELVSGGFIVAGHVAPAGMAGTDYVAVAESLIGTPYLWGGTSAFGLDCSGLVQLSMRMCGRKVLRDSDMQQATIGELLSPTASMRRGDLIFWNGHVAVFCDERSLVHASGHAMQVVREPAGEAIGRIAAAYGDPLLRRRP
jgi:cell wall-associated NlpC family hydrolase